MVSHSWHTVLSLMVRLAYLRFNMQCFSVPLKSVSDIILNTKSWESMVFQNTAPDRSEAWWLFIAEYVAHLQKVVLCNCSDFVSKEQSLQCVREDSGIMHTLVAMNLIMNGGFYMHSQLTCVLVFLLMFTQRLPYFLLHCLEEPAKFSKL